MKRILHVVDCRNWAIDKLVSPLIDRDSNMEIVYHYTTGKEKNTRFNTKYDKHLVLDDFNKDYDIIHFHCLGAMISCLQNQDILKSIGKRQIVFTIHTEREQDVINLIESKIKIDKVICPTKYIQERLKNNYKTFYIPHCIDIDKFPYIEKLIGEDVGYVGRIVRHKRYKEIADACRGNYKVNGIGYIDDGTYWRSIDNIANKFNINVGQENMAKHIHEHFKIFVCLSIPHIEVGPLPVLECMALGIPVLTTDVGWAKDNADFDNCWFIEESQISNLGKYIDDLMQDNDKIDLVRKNARKLIEKFNMDWYLQEHRRIYESY
jgi:glycosyltransferase involved in cell wall biosynthesis